jgi:hypothetical protein
MPEKSRYPNGGRFTKGNTHNRRGHRKSYISKGIEEHRLVVETRLETETEIGLQINQRDFNRVGCQTQTIQLTESSLAWQFILIEEY